MGRLSNWGKIVQIVIPILTFVFGSGAMWQYQKLKMDKVMNIAELREKLADTLVDITEKSFDYYVQKETYYRTERESGVGSSEAANAMRRLEAILDVKMENFREFEIQLADLENREPREINLDFIPPSAPGPPIISPL